MMITPLAHIDAIDIEMANNLLVEWGHRMGPVRRPKYAIEAAHALFQHGRPVAVTVAGETVREVVGQTGITRDDAVELIRLCAARSHLCRPMLRLWREMIFPPIAAAHRRTVAISYQDQALHRGDVYRFDGWLDIGKGGRGGTDARTGRSGRSLRIWAWPPDEATSLMEGAAA